MVDRSTESYRLAAPTSVSIKISSNFAGVVIRIGGGPSSSDPLAQRRMVRHFTTLTEALSELPGIVQDWVDEQHAVAAQASGLILG